MAQRRGSNDALDKNLSPSPCEGEPAAAYAATTGGYDQGVRRQPPTLFSASVAALVLLGALTGCTSATPEPGPTPLSVAESEALSAARFRNFDLDTRAFTMTFRDAGAELAAHGYIDFPSGLVYAAVRRDGAPLGLLKATHQELAVREIDPPSDPTLPAPVDGWLAQPLDPTASALAGSIAVLLSLGADRPENPQLLRQSDAISLGSEKVDTAEGEVTARVFVGPSSASEDQPVEERVRYWLLEDGTLLRVEVPRSGQDDPTVIEFDDAKGVDLGDALAG